MRQRCLKSKQMRFDDQYNEESTGLAVTLPALCDVVCDFLVGTYGPGPGGHLPSATNLN